MSDFVGIWISVTMPELACPMFARRRAGELKSAVIHFSATPRPIKINLNVFAD
jgi:hypothetical protein